MLPSEDIVGGEWQPVARAKASHTCISGSIVVYICSSRTHTLLFLFIPLVSTIPSPYPFIQVSIILNIALFIVNSSYELLITSPCASCAFSAFDALVLVHHLSNPTFQYLLPQHTTRLSRLLKVISVLSISVSYLSQSWYLDTCCAQYWAPMHIAGLPKENVI